MEQPEPTSRRFDRSSGLLLGYMFGMIGTGLILEGFAKRDLVFPVGGGFFVLSGIALALVALKEPHQPRAAVGGFGRFFQAAFRLFFVGFVFLCADSGLGIRWMGTVGLVLSMPFVIACVLMIVWIIPREVRRSRPTGHDT
jgi:hypothetical protein